MPSPRPVREGDTHEESLGKDTRPPSFQTHPRETALQGGRKLILVYTNASLHKPGHSERVVLKLAFFYQQCVIEIA